MKKTILLSFLVLGLSYTGLNAEEWVSCWHGKYDRNGNDEGPWKHGFYNTGTMDPSDRQRYVNSGYDAVVCNRYFQSKSEANTWATECARMANKYYKGKFQYTQVDWGTCWNGSLFTHHSNK